MYACIEVSLCGVPMGSDVQLGLGEGPIGIVGPMSQPRGTIDTASRTLAHICTLVCAFCSQLYSGQLRVTCFLIYVGRAMVFMSVLLSVSTGRV